MGAAARSRVDSFDIWYTKKNSLACQQMASLPCTSEHHDAMEDFILRHLAEGVLVVGVQGVQGCGKSYACQMLSRRLQNAGYACVCISLDDFYFPRSIMGWDVVRGPPGTHDVRLLQDTLQSLRAGAASVRLPVFDKSVHEGRGDRVGWRDVVIESPRVVVLVEGWCLGFEPDGDTSGPVATYHEMLSELFDAFIVLRSDFQRAYEWRERAERIMRAKGDGGMTPEEVRSFVAAYMPYYETHLFLKTLPQTPFI